MSAPRRLSHASAPEVVTGGGAALWERYRTFLRTPPEMVVEWNDPESPARGWLVINRLKQGAAGGGTRMRAGLGREEVEFLAKVMELKFAISGPPIGGAKSGIDFDPEDPRKAAVLGRWFRAIEPLLSTCYGTGGDLNVDEVREVIPGCVGIGLAHPQHGVVHGHIGLRGAALERRLRVLRQGLSEAAPASLGLPGRSMGVADLITGFGVARAAQALRELQGRDLRDSRVLLEGFGCVGGAAALYLSRAGARIVGIIDAQSGLGSPAGLVAEDVVGLLTRRQGNALPLDPGSAASVKARRDFWDTPADLYVCAAASGTLTSERLERLGAAGVDAIVCGSNRPFHAESPGDTRLEEQADRTFAVVPDILANCGAAHSFFYQMVRERRAGPEAIFESVERTIHSYLKEAYGLAGDRDRGLLAACLALALARLTAEGREAGEAAREAEGRAHA